MPTPSPEHACPRPADDDASPDKGLTCTHGAYVDSCKLLIVLPDPPRR